MARISTHVLDVARGRPAAGVPVELWRNGELVKAARTNADGRMDEPLAAGPLVCGAWELVFQAGEYLGPASFYDRIAIRFVVDDAEANYHIPLLLSPFGYSTYRGS